MAAGQCVVATALGVLQWVAPRVHAFGPMLLSVSIPSHPAVSLWAVSETPCTCISSAQASLLHVQVCGMPGLAARISLMIMMEQERPKGLHFA